ncbi:MAG: acetoin utilization protein AcuB [Chlamydiales bacterium]|jgi:acetoin utilization protein AcuB
MVSVFDPFGTEKFYAMHSIGKIRHGHQTSRVSQETESTAKNKKALERYGLPKKRTSQQLLFMHAKELMSSPVEVLFPEDTLKAAYEIFSQKRYRHIPIVTHDLRITGILSDRDFLRENSNMQNLEKIIGEVMSKSVLTVPETTEVHILAKIMFEERIGALPIINSEKSLSGIVTRGDILKALSQTEIFQARA